MKKSEAIRKSKIIHGDKFEYTLLNDEVKTRDKVTIICRVHGEFTQLLRNHLRGRGCRKCDFDIRRKSIDEVIRDLSKKHNNKYIYNIDSYTSNKQKIDIKCPIHGYFTQKINSHSNGFGCPDCGGSRKLNLKEFIDRSNIKHSYYYTYDKTVYINSSTPITITCPTHGDFRLTPHSHLRGSRCPKCSMSLGEKRVLNFLEENEIEFISQHIFKDCFHIKNLVFDFWIPSLRTCIEFDGKQHFIATKWFGGEEGLEKIKIRDNAKNDYCHKNNIKLIRISSIDDIKSILKKEILNED